jgi:hypothetical protein
MLILTTTNNLHTTALHAKPRILAALTEPSVVDSNADWWEISSYHFKRRKCNILIGEDFGRSKILWHNAWKLESWTQRKVIMHALLGNQPVDTSPMQRHKASVARQRASNFRRCRATSHVMLGNEPLNTARGGVSCLSDLKYYKQSWGPSCASSVDRSQW